MENTETTFGHKILNWIIPLTVLLVPIFFIPNSSVGVYTAKITLFGFLVLLSFITFLTQVLSRGNVEIPKSRYLWPLILIPVISLISAAVNGSFLKSFSGSVIEVNTTLFWILGVLVTLVSASVITSVKQIYASTTAFMFATILILAVFGLKILSVYGMFGGSAFSLIPDSLAITMIDAAILAGAATILSFNLLPNIRRLWVKVVLWLVIISTLLLLGAIGFKPVIVLLAVFSLIHFIYNISLFKKVSFASLLVLLATMLFTFGGTGLNSYLSNSLKISSFDVRPSNSITASLISSSWKTNPLLGVGPNRFSNLWNNYKPSVINSSQFWSADFTSGFSTILTSVAETGLLGALAFLAFFIMFIYAGFKSIFAFVDQPEKRFTLASLFSVSLYLWITTLIYVPGIAVLSLVFLATGIFTAALAVLGVSPKRIVDLSKNPRSNFFSIFLIVFLVIGSIVLGYFISEKAIAAVTYNKALLASTDNVDQSITRVTRAASIAPSDIYWRALSSLYSVKMQTIIASVDPKAQDIKEDVRNNLQAAVASAVGSAQNAIKLDNKNYLNWMALGSIYEALARAGVTGSDVSAKNAYVEAEKVAPNNPAIQLGFARLALGTGDLDGALKFIEKAISLKSNFSDAYFLKAQIEVSKNDIPGAIKSVENAAIADPTNAGLLFQLGLLKYNARDYIGAIESFKKAITVAPDYANAKYFLGLSDEILGLRPEAIAIFEDIQKTNPDNAEIKFILDNLKAGKSPFTDVKPPLDNKPEKRKQPPVKETSS